MVTAESPEAMEEVLWTAFFPRLHDPEVSNILDGQFERPELESFFAEHIRKLILARGGQRYVSKNNYNVTRLSYFARLFPDARFLLPIRSPLAHVGSLMKQHGLFSKFSARTRRHAGICILSAILSLVDRRPINPAARRRNRDRGLLGARRGSSRLGEVLGAHVPSPRRSARSRSRGGPPLPGSPLRGLVRSGASNDDSSMRTHWRACRPGRASCCRTAPARLLYRPIHRCGIHRHHRRDICGGRSLRLPFHRPHLSETPRVIRGSREPRMAPIRSRQSLNNASRLLALMRCHCIRTRPVRVQYIVRVHQHGACIARHRRQFMGQSRGGLTSRPRPD